MPKRKSYCWENLLKSLCYLLSCETRCQQDRAPKHFSEAAACYLVPAFPFRWTHLNSHLDSHFFFPLSRTISPPSHNFVVYHSILALQEKKIGVYYILLRIQLFAVNHFLVIANLNSKACFARVNKT